MRRYRVSSGVATLEDVGVCKEEDKRGMCIIVCKRLGMLIER